MAAKDVLVGFGDDVRVGDLVEIAFRSAGGLLQVGGGKGLILDFDKNIECPTITFIDVVGKVNTIKFHESGKPQKGWRREFTQITNKALREAYTKCPAYRRYMQQNGYDAAQEDVLDWAKTIHDMIEIVYFIKTAKLSIIIATEKTEVEVEKQKLISELESKYPLIKFEIYVVKRKMAFALMEEFESVMEGFIIKDILHKPRFFFSIDESKIPCCIVGGKIKYALVYSCKDGTSKLVPNDDIQSNCSMATLLLDVKNGKYYEVNEYGRKI